MADVDDTNERAVIGGNNPPPETLDEIYADHLKAVEELAARANELPKSVEGEDTLAKVTKVVVDARSKVKGLEAVRKDANEPFHEKIKEQNRFFATMTDRLERIQVGLTLRVESYQQEVARQERLRREEEAEARRKEAERLAEEAAKAQGGAETRTLVKEAEKAELRAQQAERQAQADDIDMARMRSAGGTVSTRGSIGFKVADYSKLDLRELKDSFTVAEIDKAIRAHIKRNKKTKPLKGVEMFDESKASIRG